jgi:hypothetical protein
MLRRRREGERPAFLWRHDQGLGTERLERRVLACAFEPIQRRLTDSAPPGHLDLVEPCIVTQPLQRLGEPSGKVHATRTCTATLCTWEYWGALV